MHLSGVGLHVTAPALPPSPPEMDARLSPSQQQSEDQTCRMLTDMNLPSPMLTIDNL